jgi:hypothetical protein
MTLNLEQLYKFHDYLCSLDYYQDFKEELYAPEIEDKRQEVEVKPKLREIPLTFDTVEAYKAAWQDLFFLEAKAQIKKAEKEEASLIRILLSFRKLKLRVFHWGI